MVKRNKGLVKKTTLYGLIGLSALIIALTPRSYQNICQKQKRYDAALSKTKELVEYDNVPGISSNEWLSFYRQIGQNTKVENIRKPKLKEMEEYLGKFGFYFNGKKYSNDIAPD